MLALLIEDVTLVAGPSIAVHVRWRGGRTQSLCVDKPRPIAQIRKTPPDVVKLIDELLETSTDKQVAAKLTTIAACTSRSIVVNSFAAPVAAMVADPPDLLPLNQPYKVHHEVNALSCGW